MSERILVIADDPEHIEFLLTSVLSPHGYLAQTASCGQAGLKAARDERPDLVLLDLILRDVTAAEMLQELQVCGDPPVILMTPAGAEAEALRVLRLGARDALIKPFAAEEIVQAIVRVLHQERLAGERDWLVRRLAASNEELESLLQTLTRRVQETLTLQVLEQADVEPGDVTGVAWQALRYAVRVTGAKEGVLSLQADKVGVSLKERASSTYALQHEQPSRTFALRVGTQEQDVAGHKIIWFNYEELASRLDPQLDGVVQLVLGSGKSGWTGNGTSSPAHVSPSPSVYLAVPIQYQDSILGAIGLQVPVASLPDQDHRVDVSVQEDLDFLSELADRVAGRLSHARLFAELAAAQHKTDLILQHTGEGVYTVDKKLNIVSVNPAMERITGWPECELLGRRYEEVFKPESGGRRLTPEQTLPGQALRTERALAQSTILRQDGRRILVNGAAALLRDADESVIGVLATMRDLTPEVELKQLYHQLATMINHCLRAPLTQVSSIVRALFQADLPTRTELEILNELETQSIYLNQLTEGIKDALHLEVNTTQANCHPVTLKPIIDQVVKSFQKTAPGRLFEIRLVPDLPFVLGDEDQIELALNNLIDNALLLSDPQYPVVISAHTKDDWVVVSVEETSAAISTQTCVKLDHSTQPVDSPNNANTAYLSAPAHKRHDAGAQITPAAAERPTPEMGLYVAKKLIQAQGGQIWINDRPGTNTSFCFSLPQMEVMDVAQAFID